MDTVSYAKCQQYVNQGPLLEALSSYRYVAHSFAVILSLVAAEQAARAGVVFAGSLWFKGGLLSLKACSHSGRKDISHKCGLSICGSQSYLH